MFGLSWGQIAIIVLVGVFVLGPERIPTAVTWVLSMMRKARTMAAGAQAELRREIGPELEELRRQVADLQSLKEIQELRDLRDLNPKRLIGKNILGDEFSGGITGFLGLGQPLAAPTGSAGADAAVAASGGAGSKSPNMPVAGDFGADPAISPPHLPPSMAKSAAPTSAAPTFAAPTSAAPELAAPRVVGVPVSTTARALAAGERPPFDPDGT